MVDRTAADRRPRQGWSISLGRKLALAAGYTAVSLLGTFLVPAGTDDVVILRGFGIAAGALLVFGRDLWPGVFVGAVTSRLLAPSDGDHGLHQDTELLEVLVMAGCITVQALFAAWLIRRVFGFPLRIRGFRQLAFVTCLLVPMVCLLVPSVGIGLVASLHPPGTVDLARSWIVWWVGDMIGILLAVPVALLGPWNRRPVAFWRGTKLPQFSKWGILYLALSTAVTFLSWNQVSRIGNAADEAQFTTLVRDNTRALEHRLAVYNLAVGGGVGLYRGSQTVALQDWRNYVAALDLEKNVFDVRGIGFMQFITPERAADFRAEAARDGVIGLKIHPESDTDPMFVVKYIEPMARNQGAVGANLAIDEKLRAAAVRARDTGTVTITEPASLDQDSTRNGRLMILGPVYSGTVSPMTIEQRRAAFVGWVYLNISAARIVESLTESQSENLRISTYIGPGIDPGRLFYSNADESSFVDAPRFRQVDTVDLYGTTWTVEWTSSPAFEARTVSIEPLAILIVGLLFSGLFGIFLLNLIRREELVTQTAALRSRELAGQVEENRSIIDSAVTNIAFLDSNGRVIRVNKSLIRLLGRKRAELIGQPFSSLINEDMTGYFSGADAEKIVRSYRSEVHTVSSLGPLLTLDVQVVPWVNSEGGRRYTAVMRNITEQRHVQDQLRATQHRLDLALTGAKMGVFDVDLRTGQSIVSQTWRVLLGYEDDEGIHPGNSWRDRIHPEDKARVDAADLACIEGRAQRSISEYRIRMRDGSWRWMRSDAVGEERDADGRAWRLIGLQSDVTEQRQVEELKNQFVSTVSHELRTPLTSISGSISLLLNGFSEGLPDAGRRMLTIAQRNCERLILLVNEILDLERLEAGPQKPRLAGENLSAQVRRAIEVNRPFATRFNVTYDLVLDDPTTIVMMEEHRFQQILTNLLSNAAKFSPKGGTVEIALENLGDMARVSVTDRGPGIPAAFHDRLFKAFSQVDGSANRQADGTGLGLHIAKRTVEQLDGRIGFTSEPWVATTFWVEVRTGTAVGASAEVDRETSGVRRIG